MCTPNDFYRYCCVCVCVGGWVCGGGGVGGGVGRRAGGRAGVRVCHMMSIHF